MTDETPTDESKLPEEQKLCFSSDDISVELVRKPDCLIDLKIKTTPGFIKPLYDKGIKAVAKGVSFPGFRKGKAPIKIIVEKYPKQIEAEAKELISQRAFVEASRLTKVSLVSDTKVGCSWTNTLDEALQEGAQITYQYETYPTIPDVEIEKYPLKKVEKESIDEEKVKKRMEEMQQFFGTPQEVEDRPVKLGDDVILTISDLEVEPAKPIIASQRFHVAEERMSRWMYEAVLGMTKGEAKETTSQPDEALSAEEKAKFPPKKVRVTVENIRFTLPHPLDNDLAQKMGCEDLATFKKLVKRTLENRAKETVQDNYRSQLTDFLKSHLAFDLPNTPMHQEVHSRFTELAKNQDFLKQFREKSEEEQKSAFEAIKKEARQALRLFYFSHQVLSDHNIKVTPEEIEKEATPWAQLQKATQENLKEQHAIALSKISLRKALDILIEKILSQMDNEG